MARIAVGAAQPIERSRIGAERTVSVGRRVRGKPKAAMTPILALAAPPFHLPERVGHRLAVRQAGTIDAETLHHLAQLLRRARMGAHQPRHIAWRDAAVRERALELSLLAQRVELAAEPRALAPAFDRGAQPIREPGDHRWRAITCVEVTRR